MKKFNKNSIVTALIVSFVLGLIGLAGQATFAAGPAMVNLGTAGNFVILAKSGISTTGSTSIIGDIGVSPIAASAITGFGLIMDVSNTFSTSARVTGRVYAADYAAPTPVTMTTAVSDMQTAYTDAAGRTNPTATELGAGNIGGMTLAPGLYKWSTGLTIPTDVTLSGGANDVWIFQVAQNLTISSAMHVILAGGAQASNVFWVVAGQTTLGTTSVFNGNILDQTAIVLQTGATLNGRALAQTAVTLDSNTVTKPTATTPTPVPTPTSTTSTQTTSTVAQTSPSATVSSGGVVVPPLTCSIGVSSVNANQAAILTAAGGNGTYFWSGPNLNVTNSAGNQFAVSYPNPGTYLITVASAGQTATCAINVLSSNFITVPVTPSLPNTGGGYGQ